MRRRLREHSALLRAPRVDNAKLSRSQKTVITIMLKRPMATAFQAWKAARAELQGAADEGKKKGRLPADATSRHARMRPDFALKEPLIGPILLEKSL